MQHAIIKYKKIKTFFIFLTAFLLIISCGTKNRVPTSQLDTPQHHTDNGLKLLGQEKYVDARKSFELAVKINPQYAAAYYFMGLAYKAGLEFDLAGQMFTKVIELKSGYMEEADGQLKFLQKVQRAMPGTTTGKQIALVERLTRADAAALFIEELRID